MDYFYFFMNILGTFFPPMGAIMIDDFYLKRKGKYYPAELFNEKGPYFYYKGFNPCAWGSFAVGVIVFQLFKYVPWLANSIGSLYPAFAVTCIVYFIAAKIGRKSYKDLPNSGNVFKIHSMTLAKSLDYWRFSCLTSCWPATW